MQGKLGKGSVGLGSCVEVATLTLDNAIQWKGSVELGSHMSVEVAGSLDTE